MSSLINGTVNPTVFIQIPLHTIIYYYSVRSHVSQFHLNVYKHIEVGSTNERKWVAWDDVTN